MNPPMEWGDCAQMNSNAVRQRKVIEGKKKAANNYCTVKNCTLWSWLSFIFFTSNASYHFSNAIQDDW